MTSETDEQFVERMDKHARTAVAIVVGAESAAEIDRLFALARRGAEGWVYLKKGERRPVGQVLVAYHDKRELEFEKALMGDEAPITPKLAIACWVKSHGVWMTRNLMVDGVYAWMPLPPPPPAGETNEF